MPDVFAASREAEREFKEHLRNCAGCSTPTGEERTDA